MEPDDEMNNPPVTGDDSEMTMTQMPIESAAMSARGDHQPQPTWTPSGDTGSIPQYQEYQQDGTQVDIAPVDLAGFLRAQVAYSTETTLFLEQGRSLQGDDYVRAMARYSRSQSAMIRAYNALLSQLGVL